VHHTSDAKPGNGGALTPVREILGQVPLFQPEETGQAEAASGSRLPVVCGPEATADTVVTNEITREKPAGREADPASPYYNWQKYGYTLVTEETFRGGPHPGDYEENGVLYCGYCHKPKSIQHRLLGKLRRFPVDCDCMSDCRQRIALARQQREKQERAEACRRHALPFPYMRQWDFAHDDGDSPHITGYARQFTQHFPELKQLGLGLFLFGSSGTGKTFTAAEIVNALCDEGYHCLVTSFLEIINRLLSLNRENRHDYIDEVCRHDLLVFEDYGTEPETYFSDMNVLEIVNTCYQKRIPLIITTPLPRDALSKAGNPTRLLALARLKERCYCLTLTNTRRKRSQAKERAETARRLLGIGPEALLPEPPETEEEA